MSTTANTKGKDLNLYEKIVHIKAELVVEKTGWDEQQEYAYFKADDVARDVHAIMTEYGIMHKTEIEHQDVDVDNFWDKQGRNRPRVTTRATVTFIDAATKDSFGTNVVATGSDIGGDKATRKLMVQIFKEAAIDVFGITEGMQSFDSDTYEQAEPDVEASASDELPPPPAADSKELGLQIKHLIEDPTQEHIDGDMVNRLGRQVAAEILGATPSDRVWRKDARVLEPLVRRLEAGEVPLDNAPVEAEQAE